MTDNGFIATERFSFTIIAFFLQVLILTAYSCIFWRFSKNRWAVNRKPHNVDKKRVTPQHLVVFLSLTCCVGQRETALELLGHPPVNSPKFFSTDLLAGLRNDRPRPLGATKFVSGGE